MSKLRHIALSVNDPWEAAKFYEKAFDMERVGETRSELADGVYLSDGIINLALLRYKTDEMAGEDRGKDYVGLHHIGFWIDDLDETHKRIENAGGHHFMGSVPEGENVFYEVKYRDPNGIIFDVTENGWGGAEKDSAPPNATRED